MTNNKTAAEELAKELLYRIQEFPSALNPRGGTTLKWRNGAVAGIEKALNEAEQRGYEKALTQAQSQAGAEGWFPIDANAKSGDEILVYGIDARGDEFQQVVRYGNPHWYIGKRDLSFIGDDSPTHYKLLDKPGQSPATSDVDDINVADTPENGSSSGVDTATSEREQGRVDGLREAQNLAREWIDASGRIELVNGISLPEAIEARIKGE